MELYTLHLFAGAGGGILGDLLLGHRPIGAVEIESYPRKVLLARQLDGCLPRFPIWDDVRTFRSDNPDCAGFIERCKNIRDRLCICGGFPCQDISAAGKGAGITGERSDLWKEYARLVCEIRPAYVFVENSPMLTIRGLGVVLADLAKMGYDAKWGVLGGDDANMDTDGERIWIIAKTPKGGRSWILHRVETISDRQEKSKCFSNDGRSRSRIERISALESLAQQPAILGSSDGISNPLDRLNAIGNAQIPLLVKLAWETLTQN